jgi:hypothetical protein
MDKNIAAFLRNDTKTVSVRFIKDNFDKNNPAYANTTLLDSSSEFALSIKVYTYITDLDLKENDLVVVFAQGVPKVVVVASVHDELQIKPNEDVEYRWVVCKLDLQQYRHNLYANGEISRTVAKSYQTNVRRQFQSMMLDGLDEAAKTKLMQLTEKKS